MSPSELVLMSVDHVCCPYGAALYKPVDPRGAATPSAAHDFRSLGSTFAWLVRVFRHAEDREGKIPFCPEIWNFD